MLYEYLVHRLYKFEFFSKPNIIDKESFFIPAGYDSLNLLNSFDVQNDLSKIYSERINSSKVHVKATEEEVVCEESQAFLKKFYGQQPVSSGQSIRQRIDKTPSEKTIQPNAYQTQPTPMQNAAKEEILRNSEPVKSEINSTSRTILKESIPSMSNFSTNTDRTKNNDPKDKAAAKPSEKISASEQLKKRLADLKNTNK